MDAIANGLKLNPEMRKLESESLKGQELQTGFIAQEVEKAAKELGFDFSGVDKPKNENDYYGLRYAEFVVPLVKAVQELDAQNKELKIKVAEMDLLKAEIQSLKNLINK